ncbi:mannitol dehydrogenase family protein [Clostridium sp. MCC353]|uniref:mannitol dehydrogenase family protein n=1 Tax=Clostridium sp. MCC353 TaxID=2592646 RepID=UPI001C027D31|nr:mannitol dehydrogenase family protein [Clostridium sp. MCC353]MBT9776233.1 mannitol dehydrogenase family protein [Clostridium sp. MCC353]
MKLNRAALKDRNVWEAAGFSLPEFDMDAVAEETYKNPAWVHMGAGNIFRAFTANVQQKILNEGKSKTGIIAAEGFDYEIIDLMYKTHDNLGVLVTLKADGSIEKTLVGSITEAISLNRESVDEWNRLVDVFTNPSLQMVSFTITEKGYSLVDGKGEYYKNVQEDFANGPEKADSYIGKVATLLYKRYQAGELPVAMVSMDNCSHNGDKLYSAVNAFAKHWSENGVCEKGFYDYVNDRSKVSFPWSMIDKITPRPDEKVKQMLQECGFEDVNTKVTSKNTYVATFVNAEEPQYLVIEDAFPNGRPNLDEGGIIFTDRETVDKVEKMKVCTCLNPLHTALAVYGCLLGYTLIADEMKDEQLKRMVEVIGYEEGLPVVVDPGILSPKAFIDEVLQIRIPNPFMPDTPQRIATDTSQKLGIRYGETIKAYLSREDLDVKNLKLIPLVLAGWCRYLLGVDDNGEAMELSSDPLLDTVRPCLADIKLGDQRDFHEELKPILSNDKIFGINLYEAGLGETVESYFKELTAGKGAVRATLVKYVK